jgi:hypothetical protein
MCLFVLNCMLCCAGQGKLRAGLGMLGLMVEPKPSREESVKEFIERHFGEGSFTIAARWIQMCRWCFPSPALVMVYLAVAECRLGGVRAHRGPLRVGGIRGRPQQAGHEERAGQGACVL